MLLHLVAAKGRAKNSAVNSLAYLWTIGSAQKLKVKVLAASATKSCR